MKYTLGSSAPSYIFHNQHKTLNNLYLDVGIDGNLNHIDIPLRKSRDKVVDMYGRKLLDMCKIKVTLEQNIQWSRPEMPLPL